MYLGGPVTEEFIQKYPDSLIIKDVEGFTPFHRAVAFSNRPLMDTIIKYGFDINTRTNTDLQETSLHLCARSGNLPTMKKLIDMGINLAAVDCTGCDVMHHAIADTTGKMVHYLHNIHNLTFNSRDDSKRTLLMKSVSIGNIDLTKYLLRDKKCDILAQDEQGNTALHLVTGLHKLSYLAYLMVQNDPRVVNVRNNEGKLAFDYIIKGNPYFKSMISALKVEGINDSNYDWYKYVALPPIGYTLMTIANHTIMTNPIALFLMIAICVMITIKQSHRIFNHFRTKNPLFYSLFFTGLVANCINSFVYFTPYYIEKDKVWVLCILFVFQFYGFYLFYRFGSSKPNAIVKSALDKYKNKTYTIEDVADGTVMPGNFCINCEIIHSDEVKHCRLCEKCFFKIDHHCLFLYQCVTDFNYPIFVKLLYIILLNGIIVISVYCGILYLNLVFKGDAIMILKQLWKDLDLFMISIVFGTGQVGLMCIGVAFDIMTNHGEDYHLNYKKAVSNILLFFRRRRVNLLIDIIDLRKEY